MTERKLSRAILGVAADLDPKVLRQVSLGVMADLDPELVRRTIGPWVSPEVAKQICGSLLPNALSSLAKPSWETTLKNAVPVRASSAGPQVRIQTGPVSVEEATQFCRSLTISGLAQRLVREKAKQHFWPRPIRETIWRAAFKHYAGRRARGEHDRTVLNRNR